MASFATKTQIRADDMASPVMKRIAAQARITARSFKRLNAAADTMKRLGGLARPLERGIVSVGFASAAAGAGVLALTNRYATATDESAKFARQIGFSAGSLERLKFVADRQGASFETLRGGLGAFTKRMGELRAGTGGLLGMLKKTDPAFAEMLAGTTDNEKAFELFIAKVAELPDAQSKAALAAAGVSRGAMGAVIRLTDGGTEAIARLNAQADKFRAPMTERDTRNAEAYKDAQTNISFAMKGIGDTIGRNLLPALTPATERLADWVALNRPLLDAKLDAYGDKIAASLDRIDFDRVAEEAQRYTDGAQHVITQGRKIVDSLGGVEGTVKKVAIAWAILRGLSLAALVIRTGVQVASFATAIAGMGTATTAARAAAIADFDAIGKRHSRLSAAIGKGIVFGGIVGLGSAIGISELNKRIDSRADELESEGIKREVARGRARDEITGAANDGIAKALVGLTDRLGFLKITDPRIRAAAGAAPVTTPPVPLFSIPRVPPVALVPRTLPRSTPVPAAAARLGVSAPVRPASRPLTAPRPLRPSRRGEQSRLEGSVKVEVEAAPGTRARVVRDTTRIVEPRRKPDLGTGMVEGN